MIQKSREQWLGSNCCTLKIPHLNLMPLCFNVKATVKGFNLWQFILPAASAAAWWRDSATSRSRSAATTTAYLGYLKGIVSRKFYMLLLIRLDRYKFYAPFLCSTFLKYRSFHVEFSIIRCSASIDAYCPNV
jgi:hypothetical protein